jgi:hypothetical protein
MTGDASQGAFAQGGYDDSDRQPRHTKEYRGDNKRRTREVCMRLAAWGADWCEQAQRRKLLRRCVHVGYFKKGHTGGSETVPCCLWHQVGRLYVSFAGTG